MMAGWTNISPMSRIVTINGTDVTNMNFTNMPTRSPDGIEDDRKDTE